MKLIGVDGETKQSLESSEIQNNDIFLYDTRVTDFFLERIYGWEEVEDATIFKFKIGGNDNWIVEIPADFYIMIADIHHNLPDWVTAREIVNRGLTIPLYYDELYASELSIETIDFVGQRKARIYVPKCRQLIPFSVSGGRMMLVSDRDGYHRTKSVNFTCLY